MSGPIDDSPAGVAMLLGRSTGGSSLDQMDDPIATQGSAKRDPEAGATGLHLAAMDMMEAIHAHDHKKLAGAMQDAWDCMAGPRDGDEAEDPAGNGVAEEV